MAQFATDLPELGGRKGENWPFTAIRLDNGNTLVDLTHGNKVVELDPQGKVVWLVTNDDLPESRSTIRVAVSGCPMATR